MRLVLSLLLALVAAPASADPPTMPAPDATPVWVTYNHSKIPFSVSIPATHFYAEPQRDAGDGARFISLDGASEIVVFANYNASDETLESLLQGYLEYHADDQITYRRQGDSWFVLSGYRSAMIFYSRISLGDDAIYGFQALYPTSQRALYDDLLAVMAKSFKP